MTTTQSQSSITAGNAPAFTQAEELTLARLAETISASIARKAGSGENLYMAVCRVLTERSEIVRAVHAHDDLLASAVANVAALEGVNKSGFYTRELNITRAAIAKAAGATA